jgi:hypothetical protein
MVTLADRDPTTNKPLRPRRWIPLSLWFYLTILAILGPAAVWIGISAYRQPAALREIARVGGRVVATQPRRPKWLRDRVGNEWRMKLFDEVLWLRLDGSKATDSSLSHVGCLTSLQHLSLDNTQVTDLGLVHLKGLTGLSSPNSHIGEFSGRRLLFMRHLGEPLNLSLVNTRVTDAGVADLQRALPGLRIRRYAGQIR